MKKISIYIWIVLVLNISLFSHELFSEKQRDYLNKKVQIKMCTDPSWEPFEYIQEGKHKGMVADILAEYEKKLPIPIVLVETKSWAQSLEYVKLQKCDMLAAAIKTPQRKSYLKFSKSYLKFPQVMVTKIDEKFIVDFEDVLNKKIGVVKGTAISDLLKKKYPNINIINVNNIKDGLYKVESGELYGLINTSAAVSYAIFKTGMIKNLKIATNVGIDYQVRIAANNQNKKLIDIFNKIIDNTNPQKIKEIKNKWLYVNVETNVNYTLVYQVTLIALFIIVLILYWNNRLKKEIEKRKQIQKELELAKSNADDANRAKSDFLAKMSHELRTPMNAVLGMMYLLEQTKTSSIQESYIKKAKHAAKSLLGIINDILDFSKIEAGKFKIQISEFNFNDMLTNVLSVMSVKAEEKNLELLANYDYKIPTLIQSDILRIEQVLNNLLSNAIKFTRDGEVILSVKLLEQLNNDVAIRFCIEDTGVGIAEKDIEKIFEKFSQVDSSQTRSTQGTGLGLTISKKLVNLLGGDIWCESKKGKGSKFYFTIKCKVSENKILVDNRYEFLDEIKNLNCLIVDDNQNAIDVLEKMLLSFNYTVVSTLDGKDAIGLVNENKFDLVFIDFKMEDFDGLETFRLIKDILKANGTKVLMLTNNTKDILLQDVKELEIDGFLCKPISPSSLYDKIVEIYYSKNKSKMDKKIKTTDSYFENTNILLVEDNELNIEFASQVLNTWQIKVDTALDGIEALKKVKEKKYDLILMDIQMPHMDGIETTKMIRKMQGEYYKKIPIIAVSANALLGDKEKSIEAGMQDHLTKPLNPHLLFEVLSFYLKDKIRTLKETESISTKDGNLILLDKKNFDVEEAMSRINHNEKAYIKILKQFRTKYQYLYDELSELFKNNDLIQLHEKIHEVKGISANISAKVLFETLQNMDLALKKESFIPIELIQNLKIQLENVFLDIDKLSLSDSVSMKFDKQEVIKLLDEIRDNLDIDIVGANLSLEKLLPYLQDKYDVFAKSLLNTIDEFQIDDAKELIITFKREIENE